MRAQNQPAMSTRRPCAFCVRSALNTTGAPSTPTNSARLEALCRALRLHGVQSRRLLRHGIPFRETLRVADEVDPCLIVLASHGRSALQEMLAGSTFENVVRLSRHPVLVARRPQEKMTHD